MVEHAFSTKKYSVEENYGALEKLVTANPQLWSDKYLFGTGSQLLRVIAAGQSANGIRNLQTLLECYSATMQRRDSLLGYAQTYGYPVFRGSNDILELKVLATTTTSITARSVIGTCAGVDIVTVEPCVLNSGQISTIKVKIGNLLTAEQQIVNIDYRYVRFLNTNISDDIILYRNGEQVEYSKYFKDFVELGYVIQTNAYGGVDVYFMNTEENPVLNSDTYKLNYIEYTDIEYALSDMSVESIGIIKEATMIQSGEAPEQNESIRGNVRAFADTQRETLAFKDPEKILPSLILNAYDYNAHNLNSVHSLLTYCYKDKHLVSNENIVEYEHAIAPKYYFGFCPSNIVHPIYGRLMLDFNIELNDIKYSVEVNDLLNNSLDKFTKLGSDINLHDIEYAINNFTVEDYKVVKTNRVSLHSEDLDDSTSWYRIGDIVKNSNDVLYHITDFKYETGETVPTTDQTVYVVSGDCLLQPYRLVYGASQLTAETYYKLGDILRVTDTYYVRILPNINLSAEEPTWNENIGDLTFDGSLIWSTIKKVVGVEYDSALKGIQGMIVTPDGSEVSYQLIGYRYQNDSATTMNDRFVYETVTEETVELSQAWNEYTEIEVGSVNIYA